MFFRIDNGSGVAPFEQVRAQVIEAVRAGTLPAGTKLPTVRHLADELDLAPNTVARSYRELEREGVVETHGRKGTFVSVNGDVTHREAQTAALAYAERVRHLQFDPEEALELVRAVLWSAREPALSGGRMMAESPALSGSPVVSGSPAFAGIIGKTEQYPT